MLNRTNKSEGVLIMFCAKPHTHTHAVSQGAALNSRTTKHMRRPIMTIRVQTWGYILGFVFFVRKSLH